MADRGRAAGAGPGRRRPAVEVLEGRTLLTILATGGSNQWAARAAQVRHDEHQFVSELQRLELASQATPAQYLALRDDARAISAAATAAPLAPEAADAKALDASLQLDRAPLEGWVGDPGWATIRDRLAQTLDGLGVPDNLIDRTAADMRAIATSANVTSDGYNAYTFQFDRLRRGEESLPSGYGHFPDPGLYYTQHLRGFFRGGAVQRRDDQARLDADSREIRAEARDTPADAAALRRTIQDLETIGAGLTTADAQQFGDAFAAAFGSGPPTPGQLAALDATLRAAVSGVGADPGAPADVDRLVAGAPAFFRAVGGSPENVRTIVADVRAVVADGGGSPLNPFKIEVAGRTPAAD